MILLAYKLVPVKDKLGMAFIFYIITLFVSSLDLAFFREIIQSIPILESRVVYLSDVYAETVSEAKALNSFHVVLSENISYWLIQILIVAVYFCYNRYKRMQSEALTRLFVFSLLIYGFSNLLSLAPSGGRFIVLSKMFMLPLIILVLMRLKDVALVRKVMFAPVLLLFPIIFELRVGMDYYGIMLFLGNFFTAPFIVSDIPLIDFVKQSIL